MLSILASVYKWLGIALIILSIIGGGLVAVSGPLPVVDLSPQTPNDTTEPGFFSPPPIRTPVNFSFPLGVSILIFGTITGVSLVAVSEAITLLIEIHGSTMTAAVEAGRLRDDIKPLLKDMHRTAEAVEKLVASLRK